MKETIRIATALLVAMAVASLLIIIYGKSPLQVYGLMLARTWGDRLGFGQVIFRSTPLLFTGLSVAVAFHAGLFNIGAEGQLVAGSVAAALLGAAMPAGVPAPLAIAACVMVAAAAGAAVGAIPGALKARFGAHEVITTIMLNFIVQAIVLWGGRERFFVEQTVHTRLVSPNARMPVLTALFGTGTMADAAFFLALAVAGGCWYLIARTRRGYEMRAVGKSAPAAQAAGIPIGRVIVSTMALAGGLAGLVGSGTVLGSKGYYENDLGAGTGFMGIAVALLAKGNPLLIVPAALLFGTLAQGGLAANSVVPKEIIEVIQAVIILAVAWRGRKALSP